MFTIVNAFADFTLQNFYTNSRKTADSGLREDQKIFALGQTTFTREKLVLL